MKYSSAKEVDKLIRQLVTQGWKFWWGGKHGRIRHPQGFPVLTVPKSPSDYRAALNFRRDIRKVYLAHGKSKSWQAPLSCSSRDLT
jgi:predicted RNA binding protein YcfA (HicA-like mRNA interferase family)